MVALKEKVLSEALSLSPIDRAELIERVYSSFDFSSKEEIDEKWAIEAESRIKAFEEGKIQRVSVDDVFAGINNG
ncbi:MAG: addiction module protein [Spirochaetes bacterium GWF1_31_7]|nr:MAG: addiction module protein [Spirochaetes bacterium GWE1_32_154]OHD47002.1 MAG: addiction module protein [Spirochaetes bacterium GWF1_31_7]OHD49781.1 MAG: addiction module protein [Spirochaetes bacterium GWE2_31_10]OHD79078.1 MAG: addiction module protein [Spirochaetes bacterium RIFOXYB1_FULL_32_8]HBD95488.1 addiction module protein [Spirochaetia bacterium]